MRKQILIRYFWQNYLFDIIVILGVAVVTHVPPGPLVPCQPAATQRSNTHKRWYFEIKTREKKKTYRKLRINSNNASHVQKYHPPPTPNKNHIFLHLLNNLNIKWRVSGKMCYTSSKTRNYPITILYFKSRSHLSRAPSMSLCLAGGPPLPMSERLRLREDKEENFRNAQTEFLNILNCWNNLFYLFLERHKETPRKLILFIWSCCRRNASLIQVTELRLSSL